MANENSPGPMGWGIPNEPIQVWVDTEHKTLDDLAAVVPQRLMRAAPKEPNAELMAKVQTIQQANGIERGFCFLYLAEAVFGSQLPWLAQLIGSCFPANTMVKMADGTSKPIEDIRVGDEVISHTGSRRKVTTLFQRKYTGELHKLKVFGHPFEIEATSEHPFATVPWDGWRYDRRTAYLEGINWTRADELELNHDRVLVANQLVSDDSQPVRQIDLLEVLGSKFRTIEEVKSGRCDLYSRPDAAKDQIKAFEKSTGVSLDGRITAKHVESKHSVRRFISVTPSLARLLGIYAAEGGTDHCRVGFTFNAKEATTLAAETMDLVRGVFGVEGSLKVESERGRCTVRFDNKILQKVFDYFFPGNIYTKAVPQLLFEQPEEIRLAFIGGWMAGDGCFKASSKGFRRAVGVTVSKELARGLYELSLSCGLMLSARERKAHKRSKVAYEVSYSGNDHDAVVSEVVTKTRTCKFHKYGIARKIQKITKRLVEAMTVYDFEVEVDHSFIANGLVVHNCVASGDMRTTSYRMLAEVFALNDPESLPGIDIDGPDSLAFFAPYNYRAGRKEAGINGNSDGSLCVPHIKGKMKYGHLPCSTPGLRSDRFPEPQNQNTYRAWGANNDLLDEFSSFGKKFVLLESEPIKTPEDAKSVIVDGLKPCNICSMWSFEPDYKHPSWTDSAGEPVWIWKRGSQPWAHNMSVIGYVFVGDKWFVIIENSWGKYHKGRTWFAIPESLFGSWLKQAECQSVGEIDLSDNPPAWPG